MWLLDKAMTRESLSKIKESQRGEFLGAFYSKAVEMLDLGTYTCLPLKTAISVRVTKIEKHPSNQKLNKTWKVVTVLLNETTKSTSQVVCNGVGFEEGDIVAYMPIGGRLKGKEMVEKDMKGVTSRGVILGQTEIPKAPILKNLDKSKLIKGVTIKGGDNKVVTKNKIKSAQIFVFPSTTPVGVEITEIGRVSERVVDAYGKVKRGGLDRGTIEKFDEIDFVNFERLNGVIKTDGESGFKYKVFAG